MIHHLTAEMGAQYIAPQYYVVVKMPDEPGDIPNRFELYDWCTLDEGRVLLAFSFQEWCGDFVKTYYTGEGWNPPRPHNQDALSLAEVLEYLEPQGTWMVAFDPIAFAPGKWMRPRKVETARYCRRFATEVRRPLEKLFAEKAIEVEECFGNPDDYLWKIKELCAPSVPEIVQYAHARTSEWELNHC
jgi:hypothetical protein